MNDHVIFDGDGGALSIQRVDADSSETGLAIDVLVSFTSRDFTSRAPTRISLSDLATFARDLAAIGSTLTGNAEFVGTDGVVSLQYEIENGSGRLSGVVQWPFDAPTIRTEFSLRTDQTFVAKTSGELAAFLAAATGTDSLERSGR